MVLGADADVKAAHVSVIISRLEEELRFTPLFGQVREAEPPGTLVKEDLLYVVKSDYFVGVTDGVLCLGARKDGQYCHGADYDGEDPPVRGLRSNDFALFSARHKTN